MSVSVSVTTTATNDITTTTTTTTTIIIIITTTTTTGNLINLTKLGLNGNNLTKLPKAIGQLVNLQYDGSGLCLYDNPFTSFPDSIRIIKDALSGICNQQYNQLLEDVETRISQRVQRRLVIITATAPVVVISSDSNTTSDGKVITTTTTVQDIGRPLIKVLSNRRLAR